MEGSGHAATRSSGKAVDEARYHVETSMLRLKSYWHNLFTMTVLPPSDSKPDVFSPSAKKLAPETDDERDIVDIAGGGSDAYLTYYRRRQAGKFLSFHWPAFFVMPIWLLFRKLWLAGFLWIFGAWLAGFLWVLMQIYVLHDLFSRFIPTAALAVLAALIACPIFFRRVRKLQSEANALGLTGEQRSAFLSKRGDCSGWGLLLGLAIVGGMIWLDIHFGYRY